jgi:glycine/D-amino acid oxidase-like deaminating enzyme/nitrite reductase/ring-hydroxylating ferredoxin subunit
MPDLPGLNQSAWLSRAVPTDYPKLSGEHEADAIVVGGGIVGLTTALRLAELGQSVVLIEALRIGRQVTGGSTAKITTQHGLIYRYLVETHGSDLAAAYAEANREGCVQIKTWIATLGIDCDLAPKSAWLYASGPGLRGDIEAEAEAATALGLEARVHDSAPLPFATGPAIEFPDQAQFNPTLYLQGLGDAVIRLGGRIFEQSRVTEFDADNGWRIKTDSGSVRAPALVVATNLPVKSPSGYSRKTQPRAHTGMGFRIARQDLVEGMFLGLEEPTHSIRTGRDATGPILVVLGPKYETGHDGNVAGRFVALETWARESFAVGETLYRWTNEDYYTPDRMPFVGEPDPAGSPRWYVATGFNAWGISNGTAAGLMLAQSVATGRKRWGELYDATRPAPKTFNRGGESKSRVDRIEDIRPGGGGVFERDGELLAIHRDPEGGLNALSARCTHKGCIVTWNNADQRWDCPCHGSMFELDGEVFHGPARKPLKRLAL